MLELIPSYLHAFIIEEVNHTHTSWLGAVGFTVLYKLL